MKKRKYVKSGKYSKKNKLVKDFLNYRSNTGESVKELLTKNQAVVTAVKDDYAVQLIQAGFRDAGIWLIRNGKQ